MTTRKFTPGSHALPLLSQGVMDAFWDGKATYYRNGVDAKEDYRYAAMYEFLKLSPSFFSVLRHIEGKQSTFPLPEDLEVVKPVVEDFRHIFRMDGFEWWRKHGQYLFGTPAPAQKVFIAGHVSGANKSLTVHRDQIDAIVARIAVNQTKKEALAALDRELDALIKAGRFDVASAESLQGKYGFTSRRIRRSTLAQCKEALSYYQSKKVYPLWWIGNLLEVSPAMALTNENIQGFDSGEIAYRKQVLGITTSRIVRQGMLIAENAARGRFPSDDAFPEAMLNVYERSVGRPGKIDA